MVENWTIPSLQQICYEVLAEFSGYLCEVDPISDEGVLTICAKSSPFGLINIEELLSEGEVDRYIDTNECWEKLYKEKLRQDPKYLIPEREILRGEDYYRQAYLASYLKNELENRTLDDEDLERFINMCSGNLKLVVIGRFSGINLEYLLSLFPKALHLSLKESKVGPQAGGIIRNYIESNKYLQTLNLKSCELGDAGAIEIAQAIAKTKSLRSLEMTFNDISLAGVRTLCEAILVNNSLGIIDLSRNIWGPRELKPAANLVNQMKQAKNIIIKIV